MSIDNLFKCSSITRFRTYKNWEVYARDEKEAEEKYFKAVGGRKEEHKLVKIKKAK